MHIGLLLFACCIGTGSALADGAEPTLRRGAEGWGKVMVITEEGGLLELESKAINVDLEGIDLRYTGLQMLSVYDPESGAFWWTFQRVFSDGPVDFVELLDQLTERQSFWLSEGTLLGVEAATPPPALWIMESTGPFATREEGEKAMFEALARSGKRWLEGHSPIREISLFRNLEDTFYYRPGQAAPRFEIEVENVARTEQGWSIRLAGREGRKAEIALDEELGLRSIEEMP